MILLIPERDARSAYVRTRRGGDRGRLLNYPEEYDAAAPVFYQRPVNVLFVFQQIRYRIH